MQLLVSLGALQYSDDIIVILDVTQAFECLPWLLKIVFLKSRKRPCDSVSLNIPIFRTYWKNCQPCARFWGCVETDECTK